MEFGFLGGDFLLRVDFRILGFGILVLLSACLFLNLSVSGISRFCSLGKFWWKVRCLWLV